MDIKNVYVKKYFLCLPKYLQFEHFLSKNPHCYQKSSQSMVLYCPYRSLSFFKRYPCIKIMPNWQNTPFSSFTI